MWNMFFCNSVMFPSLYQFLSKLDKSVPEAMMQFILDPLAIPEVLDILTIHGQPLFDHIMYLTRTFAYYMYRQKQILLGHWKSDSLVAKKSKKCHIKSIDKFSNTSLITGRSRDDDDPSSTAQLIHDVQGSVPGVIEHDGHHPETWPLLLQDAGALSDGLSGTRCCDGGQACHWHKHLTSNLISIETQSVIPDEQLLISNDCSESDLLSGHVQLVVSEEGGGYHLGS